MAGQVVNEKKKVVVVVAAVVVTVIVVVTAAVAVVVVTVVEVQVGLVGWPTCRKRGPHSSFFSSGPARPSPGRASSCSDLSRIRPPSL